MLWIVLSVFEVQRGAFGVSSAARSAGRAYALAPNDAVGQARAEAAVRLALDDQGLEGAALHAAGHLHPTPRGLPQRDLGGHGAGVHARSRSHCCRRCSAATRRAFALDATHTVPIGQYQEVDRASP